MSCPATASAMSWEMAEMGSGEGSCGALCQRHDRAGDEADDEPAAVMNGIRGGFGAGRRDDMSLLGLISSNLV